MTMQFCLFVGGCADGEFHEVDTSYREWRMTDLQYQIREQSYRIFQEGTLPEDIPDSVTYNTYMYRREQFAANKKFTTIYVYDHLETFDALMKIINYYGTKKDYDNA